MVQLSRNERNGNMNLEGGSGRQDSLYLSVNRVTLEVALHQLEVETESQVWAQTFSLKKIPSVASAYGIQVLMPEGEDRLFQDVHSAAPTSSPTASPTDETMTRKFSSTPMYMYHYQKAGVRGVGAQHRGRRRLSRLLRAGVLQRPIVSGVAMAPTRRFQPSLRLLGGAELRQSGGSARVGRWHPHPARTSTRGLQPRPMPTHFRRFVLARPHTAS